MEELRGLSATSMNVLLELSLLDRTDLPALLRAYLTRGCDLFGLSVGIVSSIQKERYSVDAVVGGEGRISLGDVFTLSDTYCQAVVDKQAPVALHHVGALESMRSHPVYRGMALESYLGAPLHVQGRIVGTLNFSDTRVRSEPFTVEEMGCLAFMASSLSQALEQARLMHEQRRSDAARRDSEALFEAAFRHAAIGMAIVAPDGRWLRVNQAVCDLLGYREDELLKLDFQTLTHPDDLDKDMAHVQSLLCGQKNHYWMQKRYLHRNGELVWAQLAVSIVRDEDGTPRYFLSQIKDISAQREVESTLQANRDALELMNRDLAELARKDELTGLNNRQVMMEALRQAHANTRRSGEPLSCLFMEVDGFRAFNQTHGHSVGDGLLKSVAEQLGSVLGGRAVLGRYSADVFMVLLPACGINAAMAVGQQCRQAVLALGETGISLSVGVATLVPEDGVLLPDTDDLLRTADQALSAARECGGDNVLGVRVESAAAVTN